MVATYRSGSLIPTATDSHFTILKSDNLVIGGYASIEIVDKQNDLITLKALDEAVKKFMKETKYRNVMTNHSNVQVGEVLKNYRDSTGRLWKTGVDDVGFFVVIKLREDIEKAKEVGREIRKGHLRSFSIGGQALEKRKRTSEEIGEYNEISKLELHEVTICEKGINPEAKFDILKQDVTKMGELENALSELNSLLKEANELKKEGEEMTSEYLDTGEEEEELELQELPVEEEAVPLTGGEEEMEFSDFELKEESPDGATQVGEAGDEGTGGPSTHEQISVAEGGNQGKPLTIKSVWQTAPTLDLSGDNVEKAYREFKAEQLEKLAYENVRKSFQGRFESEMVREQGAINKSNYDAKNEVDELKKQFSDLLTTLTDERTNVIVKQEQVVTNLNIPTDDEIAKMSWDEINAVMGRLTGN
jgi:HK97 family phage prohead protease